MTTSHIAVTILPPHEQMKLPVTMGEYQSCCTASNRTRHSPRCLSSSLTRSCASRYLPRPIAAGDMATTDASNRESAISKLYSTAPQLRYEYTRLAPSLSASECMNDSRPPTHNSIPRLAPRGMVSLLACLLQSARRSFGAGGSEVRAGQQAGRQRQALSASTSTSTSTKMVEWKATMQRCSAMRTGAGAGAGADARAGMALPPFLE